jgi:transposase-like protein
MTKTKVKLPPEYGKKGNLDSNVNYTTEEKIKAVSMLQQGGGFSMDNLLLIRQELGTNISTHTLHKWVEIYGEQVRRNAALVAADPVYAQTTVGRVNEEARRVESEHWKAVQKAAFERLPDLILKTGNLGHLVMAAGVASDKLNRINQMTQELADLVRTLAYACAKKGIDVHDVIRNMIETVENMDTDHANQSDVMVSAQEMPDADPNA